MLHAINSVISKFIFFIADKAETFWANLTLVDYSPWQFTVDLILVAILFYWLMILVSGTRAFNMILGLVILAVIFFISQALQLLALGWLLERLFTVVLVAIPIIFQQELRRGLEKLGKTKFFLARRAKEIDFLKSEIIEACLRMAKHHIGALIVLRKEVSLKEYVDTGIQLSAKVSKELLISIFIPTSPLHDGAVIIDEGRVVAAACVLPHSFKEYGHAFGTRHKAALALTEATDAHVIVISEQKGTVGFVSEGELEENVTPERLASLLDQTFKVKKSHVSKSFS